MNVLGTVCLDSQGHGDFLFYVDALSLPSRNLRLRCCFAHVAYVTAIVRSTICRTFQIARASKRIPTLISCRLLSSVFADRCRYEMLAQTRWSQPLSITSVLALAVPAPPGLFPSHRICRTTHTPSRCCIDLNRHSILKRAVTPPDNDPWIRPSLRWCGG